MEVVAKVSCVEKSGLKNGRDVMVLPAFQRNRNNFVLFIYLNRPRSTF